MQDLGLLFLAAAAVAVYFSCHYIAKWVRKRNPKRSPRGTSEATPTRRRIIGGSEATETEARDLRVRMLQWEQGYEDRLRPRKRVPRRQPQFIPDGRRKADRHAGK